MLAPRARSASSRNCGPLAASRTAAVAIARTSTMPIVRHNTRKRCSAASAFDTPSSDRKPLAATPRPRPQRTFSLKVGVGDRVNASYETSRTELEPISTIATGSPERRPLASSTDIGPFYGLAAALAGLRLGSERGRDSLSDLPRPDKLGLVRKYLCALKGSSPSCGTIRSLDPSGNIRKLC